MTTMRPSSPLARPPSASRMKLEELLLTETPPEQGPEQPEAAGPPPSALQGALADSRDRWRDLVLLSADIAFETDAEGRLTFLAPDPLLGWDAASLLGQPGDVLLAEPSGSEADATRAGFDPFRPVSAARGRRVWLRRQDGGACCMSVSAAPLLDAAGRPAGARGVGADLTDQDRRESGMAAALRRAEVLDHILARTREETAADRAVQAALTILTQALGAEGAAVIDMLGAAVGRGGQASPGLCALHHCGAGLSAVIDAAVRLSASLSGIDWDAVAGPLRDLPPRSKSRPVRGSQDGVRLGAGPGGQPMLTTALQLRFAGPLALTVWRAAGARPWDEEDALLAASVAGLAVVMLEHEAVQREMAMQARTDALTGLLNRRAFLEELPRHMARLDRDEMPGTLIFADLDLFKPLNDQLGHDVGDAALCAVAALLRATFRPTDLVARLGGDEFAVWLNGADQLTAAERAETLRVQTPRALLEITGPEGAPLTVSIGIAERRTRSMEDIDGVFRRADRAMHDAKQAGRAHWRAAPAFEL